MPRALSLTGLLTQLLPAASPSLLMTGVSPSVSASGAAPEPWVETDGVVSCGRSDFTNFSADPLGGGMDGHCALSPRGWPANESVAACKAVCGPAEACAGFTFYPAAVEVAHGHRDQNSCCFRVGSLAEKPRCDGARTCAGTRCFEKPAPPPVPCALCRGAVTVFEPYQGGAPCWRLPSIVALSQSRLLAFAGSRCGPPWDGCIPRNFNTSNATRPDTRAKIGLRRSLDGGRTWLPLQVIHDVPCRHATGGQSDRTFTPTAVYDPKTGSAHVMAVGSGFPLHSHLLTFSSRDDGITWLQAAAPLKVAPSEIISTGNGLVLSSGRIMFLGMRWPADGAFFVGSDDGGRSFSLHNVSVNPSLSMEPQAVELTGGEVYLRGHNAVTGVTGAASRSTTRGDTWQSLPLDPPAKLAKVQGSLAGVRPMWVIAKNPPDSRTIFFAQANTRSGRYNGTIWRSVDGGQRWTPVLGLTDDVDVPNNRFAYSAMTAVAPPTAVTATLAAMVSMGVLYEAGDADLCEPGVASCKIVYKTVELPLR